jgi:hypothetical protein
MGTTRVLRLFVVSPAIGTAEWHAQYTEATPADVDLPTGHANSVEQTEAL